MRKRILSLLLCIVMCLSLLPTVAFADTPTYIITCINCKTYDAMVYGNLITEAAPNTDVFVKCDSTNADGKIFDHVEVNGVRIVGNLQFVMPTEPVMVEAIYKTPYNLTVTAEHGEVWFEGEWENSFNKTLPEGYWCQVDSSADPGYVLEGWRDESGTIVCTAKEYSFELMKNTNLTAVFVEATTAYTITFNMNGHGSQVPAQTVEEGNKAAKPADPTESGYTFDGWYADATFSAAFDFNTAITKDTTLYAKWTENTSAPSTGTIAISKSFTGLMDGIAVPNAAFTINGPGDFNQTLTIGADFTYDSGRGQYYCNITVPAGVYTITESNYAVNNYTPSVSFSGGSVSQDGTGGAAVTVAAGETSGVIVTNAYTPDSSDPGTDPDNPQKPAPPKLDAAPKTGDATQTALWTGMLALACSTAAAALYIGRKKEQA